MRCYLVKSLVIEWHAGRTRLKKTAPLTIVSLTSVFNG
jgi:hypothetical protein